MTAVKNVLWIMCDQLRFDYLGCAGHPALTTPNIDALAARGVRFTRTYIQSPICGPSRMSFYTGRYMRSHGSNWNGYPLRVGEPTLGHHLAEIGVRSVLVGKTHMTADAEGMARLGIDPDSVIGVREAECGFEPFERDDGLFPDPIQPRPRYEAYLREHQFGGDNPWERWANSGEGPDGELQNGWLLKHADKPARVPEEHSETPYMTRRAIEFIDGADADGRPWLCHLSYIKPHWPYIVPAPYHQMYGADDVIPAVRADQERDDPHPVYEAFMQARVARNFAKDEVRERVIPAYMGLIKQIDDQIGVLLTHLESRGRLADTMIVFTSDHGDYLGDHWLGEKDLFHEVSVKIPLIVVDPSPAADATRGTACAALVEAIDLAPTFLEVFGGGSRAHILEGRSLTPWLTGVRPPTWRDCVFSEYDYARQDVRLRLGQAIPDCRLFMAFDGRFKYVHAIGFRPMLYDLDRDPQEFNDLGADPAYADQCARMHRHLTDWALTDHNRITMADQRIANYRQLAAGFAIGYWDEDELAAERKRQGLD